MATLREIMQFMVNVSDETDHRFTDEFAAIVERAIRERYAGDRIYVPPLNSQRDPAKHQAIAKLGRTLPTGIVSERLGISRQVVSYHLKKMK